METNRRVFLRDNEHTDLKQVKKFPQIHKDQE